MMQDAELVRLCAEKVLGLEGPWCDCDWASLDLGDGFCHDCEKKVMPNPLTCDSDACAVLDKMVADEWCYTLTFDDDGHHCAFDNQTARRNREPLNYAGAYGDTRCRAIVIAALRAKGIATDTPKAG